MTVVLMLAGLLLIATSGWLIARMIALPRLQVETHLRSVESYGFAGSTFDLDASKPKGWLTGSLLPAAEGLGRLLRTRVPQLPAISRKSLSAAGIYEVSPEAVHGYRVLAALALPGVMLALVLLGGGLSPVICLLLLVLAALAWQGPSVLIVRRGRRRLERVDKALPQLVDLLVATVEAGVAFGAALGTVSARFTGPLGDELRLTLQQQQLGISTERALGEFAERCDTPYVRAFVRTIVRAESHGISIGPVMRHLSSDIRQRRRDAAREKIQKAPVKMLIPLMVFILLPLMLIVAFPAVWNLLHVLSNAGT